MEALQVSCVFTDFGMERYIEERTVSNSFFSLVSRWQCWDFKMEFSQIHLEKLPASPGTRPRSFL